MMAQRGKISPKARAQKRRRKIGIRNWGSYQPTIFRQGSVFIAELKIGEQSYSGSGITEDDALVNLDTKLLSLEDDDVPF